MFNHQHRVIGILGGMGPKATLGFYQQVLNLTEVECEQDHIATLIFSNPKIPDRSAHCDGPGLPLLTEYLVESAQVLVRGGADVIAIPCNSAHCCYQAIADSVDIKVLNMIELVAEQLQKAQINKVLLLGVKSIYRSGIYHQTLAQFDIQLVQPSTEQQQLLMDMVYRVKLNRSQEDDRQKLLAFIDHFGLPTVLGCTEFPVILGDQVGDRQIFNSTDILAKAAVDFGLI